MTGLKSSIILAALTACSLPVFAKPLVQAEISRAGDTAHLEFKGLKNWQYDVKRESPKKIVVSVAAIDDASLAKISAFSDPLVQSVRVDRNGPDGTYQIHFELANAEVESFDYLTDEPSRLIIDFYKKAEVAAQPVPKAPEAKPLPKKVSAAKPATKKGYDQVRKPAGSEILAVNPVPIEDEEKAAPTNLRFGIFDGGDENYDRFRIKDYEIREEAIVASRHNIYLPFPMLKMPVSKLDELMSDTPEYVITPKDNRENKEARLLLTLWERQRYAIFLKTYDYFVKKYPESEYLEILKNLAAFVHLREWRESGSPAAFENAKSLYSELIEKFPKSPLSEYNGLILSFAYMERGEALGTLRTMQNFLERFPGSKEVPQIRKGMAEAYIVLRKFEDAAAEYKKIIADFPKTAHAYEARYRLGDVWFAAGDFSKAIQNYEAAQKELPEQFKVFPNAAYNLAEARFWQKDYRKALNQYVQFVNMYPTNPHGGYALTRVGELLSIFGADQRRAMGAYLESYFRFPEHPGAKVARIRMLSQQMKGMKEKELKKSLAEIKDIAEKSKLDGINEFSKLLIADGLQNREEYIPALQELITYYQKNPDSLNLDAFRSRILRNISNEIKRRVDHDQSMKALEFYSDYSATWLNNSDRIDVPYNIARAYEKAGAFEEAEKLYQDSLSRRKAIVGTEREKERKAQESLPSVDSLHLRIAATAFENRSYMEAFEHLKAMGEGKGLSESEQVERVELAANIYEQRNDIGKAKDALLALSKRWQGDPQALANVHQRLSEIYMKSGDFKNSEEYANKVIEANSSDSPLSDKLIGRAYQTKGDALMGQKKSLAAVEAYQTLLEKLEDKLPLGATRYKLGKILFDRGDIKGAETVWRRMAGTNNDFLWKLGEEKLSNSKWQDEYNKYIQRIPAMVSEKKGSQE